MNSLIVLCGPVGCGKSTFIKKFIDQHTDFIHVDIFNYIQKYKDESGHIEPNGSLKAHQELYQKLEKMEGDIILELGTNREELNIKGIGKLSIKFKINIIFCLLDADICIERVMARAEKSQKRIIYKEDLEKKFKRVFPGNHIKIAQELNLSYNTLDMNLLFEEKLKIINSLIEKDMRTVVAAAVIQNKKILLVKIKEVWILPGGQLEKNETDIKCLTREIFEELPGLKISNIKFYKNFQGNSPHQEDLVNVKVYFADIKGNIKLTNEIDEVNESRWIENISDINLSDITEKIIGLMKNEGYL